MSESGDMIQAYIKKVLKIQEEQKERPLDVDEMNRIAEELGMSSDDLALIKKKLNDYIARGKGYSRYEDWDSAIEEFQQAMVLNPGNVEVLYGIANAHRHRWLLRCEKEDLSRAKSYVKRALQIDANHDASFKLASELNRGTSKTKTKTKAKPFDHINQSFRGFQKETLRELEALDFGTSKRLKKSARDKKIFGVCAGIGEYFGIDSTWVRIAFIMGVLVGLGFPVPLYILLAFVMPKN